MKSVNLPLTRGMVAIIDEDDLQKVRLFNWHYSKKKHIRATVSISPQSNKFKTVLLHRLIMDAPAGVMVDHINGNVFDNRKVNLRLCNRAQNGMNRKKGCYGVNPYKGTTQISSGRWQAQIGYQKKHYYLGSYDTPEQAAIAYNEAAIKYFGEFANLNEVSP